MQLLKDIAFSAALIAMIAIAFLIEHAQAVLTVAGALLLAIVLVWCFNSPCQPTPAPELPPVSVPVTRSILEN